MNKEIYEKILFVDKILNATINPRSYRYFRDIKKYILECDDKIDEKDKEIDRLKEENRTYQEYPFIIVEKNGVICCKNQEIERLNNIIKELEIWLKEENKYSDYKDVFYREHMGYVLDKLKELKGSDKE